MAKKAYIGVGDNYIQNTVTDTQYINTGIVAQPNLHISLELEFTDTAIRMLIFWKSL